MDRCASSPHLAVRLADRSRCGKHFTKGLLGSLRVLGAAFLTLLSVSDSSVLGQVRGASIEEVGDWHVQVQQDPFTDEIQVKAETEIMVGNTVAGLLKVIRVGEGALSAEPENGLMAVALTFKGAASSNGRYRVQSRVGAMLSVRDLAHEVGEMGLIRIGPPFGGPEMKQRFLRRLRAAADSESMALRVVPSGVGPVSDVGYASMNGVQKALELANDLCPLEATD